MSPISDPSEEYFKDGLWGWDSVAGAWKKLYVVAGTNILNITVSGTVAVAQMTPSKLTPGVCGWDGSLWRKLPIVWGYSERYMEYEEEIDVAAGNPSLDFSTVPPGEVWVVTAVCAWSAQANVTRIEIAVNYDAVYIHFRRAVPAGANFSIEFRGMMVLEEGDHMYVQFIGCALNDDVYASANGYKMLIAE